MPSTYNYSIEKNFMTSVPSKLWQRQCEKEEAPYKSSFLISWNLG